MRLDIYCPKCPASELRHATRLDRDRRSKTLMCSVRGELWILAKGTDPHMTRRGPHPRCPVRAYAEYMRSEMGGQFVAADTGGIGSGKRYTDLRGG